MLRKWVQWAFVHNESNYIKSYHYTIKYFKMKDRTPKVMYQEHYTLVHVSSSIGKYCLCLMLAWSPKLMTRNLFIPPICVRFFFFHNVFFFPVKRSKLTRMWFSWECVCLWRDIWHRQQDDGIFNLWWRKCTIQPKFLDSNLNVLKTKP